jgi:cytochrome P450
MRYISRRLATLGFKLKAVIQTTAHTLSFTFALLALYPEVQEKLLKHIKSVVPDGRRPVSPVQELLVCCMLTTPSDI